MPVTFPAQLSKPSLVKNKKFVAALQSPSLERDINLLEHTFTDSFFVQLDPDKLGKETTDPEQFEQMCDGFRTRLETQRKKIEQMADRLENQLKTIKANLAANKKTDKKVIAYNDALLKAAHGFAFSMKPVATNEMVYLIERAFTANLKKDARTVQALGMIQQVVKDTPARRKKLLTEIAAVKKAGTVQAVRDTWGSGSSTARTYYIDLSAGWDQALSHSFPSLARGASFAGTAQAHFAQLPWLADVANEAQSKASDKLKAMVKGNVTEKMVIADMADEYKDSVEEMYKLFKLIEAAAATLRKYS